MEPVCHTSILNRVTGRHDYPMTNLRCERGERNRNAGASRPSVASQERGVG